MLPKSDHSTKRTATGRPLRREEAGEVSLLFDDATVHSRMIEDHPARLVLEYTRLMMGFLLFHPAPARIAMIGLGGGSLAKYCGLKLPEADFTAVEISPEVIAMREAFEIPPDGPHFRVVCEDGAAFVRREAELFDVLLIDGFDRTGQPDQLCSAAFYDDCRDRLAGGGVATVNLYSDDGLCEHHIDCIRDSFSGNIIVIKADESENTIVFAGTGVPFPPTFRVLVQRLRDLDAAHPVCLEVTVRKILQYGDPLHPLRKRRRHEQPRVASPRRLSR